MNAILYRGRIFRPRPDAETMATVAQWLAEGHLTGKMVVPLDVCVDGLRRSIAETLRLLRRATITEAEDYRTALLQDLTGVFVEAPGKRVPVFAFASEAAIAVMEARR